MRDLWLERAESYYMFRYRDHELEPVPRYQLRTKDQDFGVVSRHCELHPLPQATSNLSVEAGKQSCFLRPLCNVSLSSGVGISHLRCNLQDYGAHGFMFDVRAKRQSLLVVGMQICSGDGCPRVPLPSAMMMRVYRHRIPPPH